MAFLQDPGTYLCLGSMNMFHEVASQLYDTIESRYIAFITDNVTPDFEMYDPSLTPPLCPTKHRQFEADESVDRLEAGCRFEGIHLRS
ncbi:uncharacterized protein RAG0_07862 [Rhynchosporium agropyri]|uniref:Uncharacterized protein n=1 Tax=Rhynchosporium agropyri TaxID=914238 RepID=A0A1E1KN91_9HELO|nr:uncharacterized protein RAG0_07862 [Rhynchosporium agropyri]